MAKPGVRSRPSSAGRARSVDTRRALVAAAIEVLKTDGFGGASARAIADKAGCNQALIFYHYGSVVDLLLAALDAVSAERLERYSEKVAHVASPADLVDAAADIFREDLDDGHVAVLAEMVAGASSSPGLGPRVAERLEPWKQFAANAVAVALEDGPLASIAPANDAAHAIVALYLGLEMLAHLDGDREPAMSLFDRARSIAGLLTLIAGPVATPVPRGSRS